MTGPGVRSRLSAARAWFGRIPPLHLLLAVIGALLLVGVVMVASASAAGRTVADGAVLTVFVRHLIFLVGGVAAFAAGMWLSPSRIRAWTPALLFICLAALIAVLVPGIGEVRGGARRWISVGGLTVQPGEAAKTVLLLWGAHVLALRGRTPRHGISAVLPLLPVGLLIAALLMMQPALSTTVALGVIMLALLWFAGAPSRLLAGLCGGTVLGVAVLGWTAGYRRDRITTFLGAGDELDAGYQSRQALLSLADGGVFGTGLGQGRAKWDYLPNAANDFIFAVIGEELGLIGALAVLMLYGVLAWTGLHIAARTADPFLRIVAAATTTWLVTQAAMNVGYVVGLLPVTGQQLPLISAGGTALVSSTFLLGLVANAAAGSDSGHVRCHPATPTPARRGWRWPSARPAQRPGVVGFGHRASRQPRDSDHPIPARFSRFSPSHAHRLPRELARRSDFPEPVRSGKWTRHQAEEVAARGERKAGRPSHPAGE